MLSKDKQFGITLIEIVVVMAIIAILATFGLPAARSLLKSFESGSGTKSIINAALSTARAIAAKEQRYAGIRFQQDLSGNQYMIFIVHEELSRMGNLTIGFRAVKDIKPIKLPQTLGVADLMVRTNHGLASGDAGDTQYVSLALQNLDDNEPANFGHDGKNIYITDITSFSIVFSPTGKLQIHDVRVRNKDGIYQPGNGESNDGIFNSPENIQNFNIGMFVQDDYAELGLGAEPSRKYFIIYEKDQFDKLGALGKFNYLYSLEPTYINQYTGTIIDSSL